MRELVNRATRDDVKERWRAVEDGPKEHEAAVKGNVAVVLMQGRED